MGNTSMVHTGRALIKVIEDPDSVRLKVCPRFDIVRGDQIPLNPKGEIPEYDEVNESLETALSWEECNILIRHIRTHRDRVYGVAE